MKITNFTTQLANTLFGALDGLQSVCLWSRTLDDQKQIFVGKGYESIWGRSCESLYQYPLAWQDFLIQDGKQTQLSEFFKSRGDYGYRTTIAYRIRHSDSEPRWIMDQSYALTDDSNRPLAMIGMAEMISPKQWEEWIVKPTAPSMDGSMIDLVRALQKELKLSSYRPSADNLSRPKTTHITIDDKLIKTSDRGRQVLDYLTLSAMGGSEERASR